MLFERLAGILKYVIPAALLTLGAVLWIRTGSADAAEGGRAGVPVSRAAGRKRRLLWPRSRRYSQPPSDYPAVSGP